MYACTFKAGLQQFNEIYQDEELRLLEPPTHINDIMGQYKKCIGHLLLYN